MPVLHVYTAAWCPHCRLTEVYLEEKGIPFVTVDIETQPEAVVQKVVEVNGGDDWVVPTLEYDGRWREGKVFNAEELHADLLRLGVPVP